MKLGRREEPRLEHLVKGMFWERNSDKEECTRLYSGFRDDYLTRFRDSFDRRQRGTRYYPEKIYRFIKRDLDRMRDLKKAPGAAARAFFWMDISNKLVEEHFMGVQWRDYNPAEFFMGEITNLMSSKRFYDRSKVIHPKIRNLQNNRKYVTTEEQRFAAFDKTFGCIVSEFTEAAENYFSNKANLGKKKAAVFAKLNDKGDLVWRFVNWFDKKYGEVMAKHLEIQPATYKYLRAISFLEGKPYGRNIQKVMYPKSLVEMDDSTTIPEHMVMVQRVANWLTTIVNNPPPGVEMPDEVWYIARNFVISYKRENGLFQHYRAYHFDGDMKALFREQGIPNFDFTYKTEPFNVDRTIGIIPRRGEGRESGKMKRKLVGYFKLSGRDTVYLNKGSIEVKLLNQIK